MKLIYLLKSLRSDEYKTLEKFLQSPYFKVSEQYLTFFRYLCRHYPSLDLSKENVQEAYMHCFKQPTFMPQKFYNLTHGLSKQLEQFLVIQMVVSPDNQAAASSLHDQLLVKSLGLRNQGLHFRSSAQELIDQTKTFASKEIEDFSVIHQLHRQVYYHVDTPKSEEYLTHLQEAMASLDRYYCMMKLQYAAEMKTRERILKTRFDVPLLNAVLEFSASSNDSDTYPLWKMYYQLVNVYLNDLDETRFNELTNLFHSSLSNLSKADQSILLRHLINCGIYLWERNKDVEEKLLSLYKKAIDGGILMDGDRITHSSFINIANLAGLCGEFNFGEAFIEQYSPKLEDTKREATVDLANAGLFYLQGNLDDAQECIKDGTSFSISPFDIIGRGLLLKIVFDRYLKDRRLHKHLLDLIRSFEKFVKSKPLSEEKQSAQLNWIRYVKKLSMIKEQSETVSEAQKTGLRQNLEKMELVVHKKWLKIKIEAL